MNIIYLIYTYHIFIYIYLKIILYPVVKEASIVYILLPWQKNHNYICISRSQTPCASEEQSGKASGF